MSHKAKVLGLALAAVLAVSAVTVVNALANGEGHMTIGAEHGTIIGTEIGTHRLEFTSEHGVGKEGIVCDETTYESTVTETTTDVHITPVYKKCHTTKSEPGTTTIHTNGCYFTLTVAKGTTDSTEQTVHFICPEKALEITHPNCTITVKSTTIEKGVTYTTLFENGKHTITMDVNVEFDTTYHGGICIFLGTPHKGTLHGSLTIEAKDTANNLVDVTVT